MNMAATNVRINPVGIGVLVLVGTGILIYVTGLPKWMSISSNEQVNNQVNAQVNEQVNEQVNLRELLSTSIDLAQKAGIRVKEIRENGQMQEKVKGETKEGAKELKTTGDMQSHRILVYGFAKAFPNLKVVSEEHDINKLDNENTKTPQKTLPDVGSMPGDVTVPINNIAVWVDPLDATQEYSENLKQYVTVMVCVAVDGIPTIGVIHKPFSKETYWGWVGRGHSVNLTPADASKANSKGPYNIIVSRSHAGQVEKVAKQALGEDTNIIPAGGAGYKTLEVITGAADAYVHVTGIKKWDICAGNALINSVNGHMSNLHGESIDYHAEGSPFNGLGLLATLYKHETFLKSVKPAFDEEQKKHKQR